MSLIKQLWIAIAVVTALALGGSLVVSTLSARHYLEQQLQVKNLDNATSLALSLSQMPKDPVTVELQISAQFDAGHYRSIRLVGRNGDTLVERVYEGSPSGAPEWFVRLIPIDAHPGVAQVQDGWHQFGTLTLESHSRYAYEALWDGTLQQLLWFVIGGTLTGLIGTFIIKHITRPLGQVVEQAEAIGGRRFVTTPEPGTMEFRSVVRAMNALSERVRAMLADESRRLEQLRRQIQHDELTGLLNRNQFMNLVDAALTRDDAHASGVLLIARIGELTALNQRFGHAETDRLLCRLADELLSFASSQADWCAGRINGSDFALLAPGAEAAATLAQELARRLNAALDATPDGIDVPLPIGATGYVSGEARARALARVDGALAAAERVGDRAVEVVDALPAAPAFTDLQAWRSALLGALDGAGVRLALFPVLTGDGRLLHEEAPMRLLLDGTWQAAGYFMPRVARLNLMASFDAAMVRAALSHIAATSSPLGINISTESLADANFRGELFRLLQDAPAQTPLLWIELPEYGAVRHLAEFRALCLALRPLGCKLGIEHVGRHFSRIGDLHDLGLDYIKVDASMIRDIDTNPGNQSFVRGLCVVAHAIGLTVIAEGVGSEAERAMLPELGLDGMTGPAIRAPKRPGDDIDEDPLNRDSPNNAPLVS
jgi:diguanylate cyclase (GGDEF)-like protein